jgi:succinate-acetate transporter protein
VTVNPYPGERSASPRDAGAPLSTQVMLRPLATPLTLGFLALAAGSFLVAATELRWLPAAQTGSVALVLMVFVAPLQALTAVLGFFARDAIAGTGMGVLSATWLSTGLLTFRSPTQQHAPALGLLLVTCAALLLVPAVTAIAGKVVAGFVMLLAAARFAVTGTAHLIGPGGPRTAAGAIGVALAVLALYAALAFELEDTKRRTILPTLRHGGAEAALDGAPQDEVEGLQHEAGVRRRL